jgi:FkbM family methyltransferase
MQQQQQPSSSPYSQLGQDLWVLKHHPHPGFYLELGAYHGQSLSNTCLLEERGWQGLSVDPFVASWEGRSNPVVKHAIWDKEAEVVFRKASELGGIDECIGMHAHAVRQCETCTLQTMPVATLLQTYKVPPVIDYLSLDVEGSELDILKAFPFDTHHVHLITVEHNWEEPKRTQIKEHLLQHGFVLDTKARWDDWYRFVGREECVPSDPK